VTWAELATRTGNLAGHLAAAGIAPGDRVALLLPNSVAWIAALRQALSAYKVPHAVQVTQHIPRTGSGKIMRFRLKELLPLCEPSPAGGAPLFPAVASASGSAPSLNQAKQDRRPAPF
jgi:acyl-CoA synthetase (AMP-forming)/AMP-acid ligase II